MFAVGRIGSYISRGVYTVSGPFHPFGGAVDIIVVEQPDGSYKSSPWYVRFGKFQGVLKASEKIVRINVNGVDADFHMHLDHKGEAFFLQEVDVVDGEQAESYMSSGDEVDLMSDNWRHQKSKSCNFDAKGMNLVPELEGGNGKILGRSNSRRGRLFGLSFGRRSMKENGFKEGEESVEVHRATSLERAEMAADLLEVRWTTNLGSSKKLNVDSPRGSNAKPTAAAVVSEVVVENKANMKDSSSNDYDGSKVDSKCSFEENDVEIPCSTNPGNYTEILRIEETYMGVDIPSFRPEISNKLVGDDLGNKTNAQSSFSEVSTSILKVSCKLDAEQNDSGISSGDEVSSVAIVSQSGGVIETVSGIDKIESTMCPDTIEGLHNCNEESNDRLLTSVEAHMEPKNHLLLISSEPVVTVSTSEMHEKEDSSESASCILGEISCNNAEIQVPDNSGNAPKIGEGLSEDCDLKKEVEETSCNVHFDNSTPLETCNCANRSPNELRSGDLCSSTGNLSSLALVSDKESSSVQDVGEYLGNPTHERDTNATPSKYSEEEQFTFSDLDDPKFEKAEEFVALPTDGGEERLSQDSRESSTEELTQTNVRDDEPHQASDKHLYLLDDHPSPKVNPSCASSPIDISKVRKNVDLDYLAPVVESLPDILFTDGNVNLGVPEPLSRSVDSNLEALKILNNDVPVSSDLGAKQQQVADVQSATDSSQISEEIKRIFSDPAVEVSLCRDYLYEGMGYEAAALAFDSKKLDTDKLSSYDSDIVKDDKLVVRIGGLYFPWEAALPIASAIGSQEREQILEPKGMIAVGQNDKNSEEMPQKSVNSSGSWRIWPFSLKKSNSMKDKNSDSGTASEYSVQKDGNTDADKTKVKKKMVKVKAPTSEQLASLNLKDGKNVITFTFSTAMLGNQQVDARIFLWKWNTRIVISDVDGTITKSDVLGQFMPLMGIDWSQTGVTHLFSAIKENGYNLMFLSARSISQAYHTRQFLVNLKQDGKPLPEGPIVISPDGLFPSLYREVIRRAPHEFKISCLEDIKALFPRDHNPFYAGFGNRDTDEFSYLKVGIPRGKIFTINPRGEVVVNRRVDTKSYTSLSILVHDMFPPTRVTEQEDYNAWNFWRLPPPDFEF